jgi:hypothetical protein
MTLEQLFSDWLGTITALASSNRQSPSPGANDLMTIFGVDVALKMGADVPAFQTFLADAYRRYCSLSNELGIRGWFYAWYDEMSGTLRCSVVAIASLADLPFACRVDVHEDPSAVAATILSSSHSSGIPAAELLATQWVEPGTEPNNLVLSIYARPLTQLTDAGSQEQR